MSDWTDWNERKTAPKPSYERPMPKFERKLEPQSEGMTVEETDASASMIQRIIGKFRDL